MQIWVIKNELLIEINIFKLLVHSKVCHVLLCILNILKAL